MRVCAAEESLVFTSEGKRYVSTVDPTRSNWTRFLRPAPDRDAANLVVVPRPVHDLGHRLANVRHVELTREVEYVQLVLFWGLRQSNTTNNWCGAGYSNRSGRKISSENTYLVCSKTIERLLKVRKTKHLNDQNLINDTQHGFREKRSCLTNLLDFFREVNRVYDRTKAVYLVYLDFQKAFDKVPHERLTAKVEAHGIRGNYSRWIRNWLTGRSQRVVIHDQASDSTLVTLGVPHGSVLGLLLFIIYINELDVGIISKINKFADDTKLCHRTFTERDRVTIQSDLTRLLQWTDT
ncbi:Reverse transcriptase domain [Trinorchestia longiramus]|nr:Reverse transcriptase domain [Trinorchestia longiramus]